MIKTSASLVLVLLSVPAYCQVSFFTPPTYDSSGNTFTGDFNRDGKLDIISDGTVQLSNGDGTFQKGIALAGTPLAVADFNNDGKLDVLEQGTGTLLAQLGNGDGTFAAPVSSPSGAALTTVAAADLNGDGAADVVGWFNNQLYVYINKGDGTFGAPATLSLGVTSTDNPVFTFGDFNGDSKTDLAVTIWAYGIGGEEIVLLGNGDGTFQTGKSSPSVAEALFAAAGDFNNDGKLDLLVTGVATYPYTVSILLGNGDGTFQAPSTAFTGAGAFVVGDVNGDGNLDVVLKIPQSAQVYLGDGRGGFTLDKSYLVYGTAPPPLSGSAIDVSTPPVAGDFNGDGKLDIAAGGVILLGRGDGSLKGQSSVLAAARTPALGDFDKDGMLEFATALDKVYILHNDLAGNLRVIHTYPLQKPGESIQTADFNKDGKLDLVVVGGDGPGGQWGYSILLGNGDGSFQAPIYYPQPGAVGDASSFPSVVGDFNQDGKPDFAVQLDWLASAAVFLGNGDGTFASPTFVYTGHGDSLVTADFNADGKADLAAAGKDGIAIVLGKGDGTFQPATFPVTATATGLFTGDLNGDGKPDLVTAGWTVFPEVPLGVYLGKGDGTFTEVPQSALDHVLGLGDFDGDGKLDAVGGAGESDVYCCKIYRGNGDGTFGASTLVTVDVTPGVPFAAGVDLNNDGMPDLLVGAAGLAVILNTTSPTGQTLTVLRGGSGSGTVTSSPSGINCGSTCKATYANGTAVTLTAAAASGSVFTGWSGGGCSGTSACTVTLSSSQTVTATFNVAPTVTLSSSATTAFAQNPVTLTATLSSATATGTVTFYDGTTALNTATVSGGTATYTTSSLAIGSHTIVAQYSGDSTFGSASSQGLAEIIVNFTVGVASGGSTSATVSPGGQAQYTLAMNPPNGGTFPAPITFAVTGLPAGATAAFNPASIPAGAGATNVTLTVNVAATASALPALHPFGFGSAALALLVFLAPVGRRSRRWFKLSCLAVLAAGSLVLSGCGSSSRPTKPQPQTYTLTVTASSGSLSNTTSLTLIVQ